jgi:hypothetical protein
VRQYTNPPGKSVNETVQMVEAVGGWVDEADAMHPSGVRAGRPFPRRGQQAKWFVIPEAAFDE